MAAVLIGIVVAVILTDRPGKAGPRVEESIRRIGRAGNDEAVPSLVELYLRGSTGDEHRRAILRSLEIIGGEAGVRALARLAREGGNAELRGQAEVRLSRIKDRRAASALVEVIEAQGRRGSLAAVAARALGKMRLREYTPLLVALVLEKGDEIAKEDEAVSKAAAEALGLIGDPAGVEALGVLLRASGGRLRRTAIRSLGKIRSRRALELLEEYLKSDPPDFEKELVKDAVAAQKGYRRQPGR